MKTCLVITTPSQITAANNTAAHFLELRTDLYKNFSLQKLVKKCTKPVIVTIKNHDKKLLQTAMDLQVHYIDLDYKNKSLLKYFYKYQETETHRLKAGGFSLRVRNNPWVYPSGLSCPQLIISYHNFKSTPSFQQLDRLVKQGVNKIAVMINRVEDNWIIAQLLQKYPNKITAIGMGELGIMTRLHLWQRISYFTLSHSSRDVKSYVSTAPGQLPFKQRNLKLYGIIGNPVQHSLSPKLHNRWFKQQNISALYQRWETRDIKIMMHIFRFFNLAGASVTMPYKQEIQKYLDRIDPVAKTIGAVNTIVQRGKKLVGYNTDWIGVKQAFNPLSCREGGRGKGLRGGRVLILGKGGAGLAARYAVQQSGAKTVLMLGRDAINRVSTQGGNDFDVLINATPIRTKQFFNKKYLRHKIVMDCAYGKPTKLLQVAKQQGCITINGLPMLVGQAKEQFRLWTSIF